jgi:hypothetical protein
MIVTNTDIQNAIRTAKNAIYSLALSRVSSIEQGQEVCYEDYLLCEKMANYISVLERVDLGDENGCIVTEDVWNIISSINGNSVLADLCLAIPNEFSNPGSSSPPVTGGCVTAVLGPLVDNSNPRRPFISVAVDGTSITGTGAPGDPLVAVGGGGGATFATQIEVDAGTVTNKVISPKTFNDSSQLSAKAPLASPTFTGTVTAPTVNVSGLTASELVATDGSKNLQSLAVATYPSLAELAYVKGVTSAIQTQIGAKAPLASPTFTGTVTAPTVNVSGLTASQVVVTDGSKNLSSYAITTAQLAYLAKRLAKTAISAAHTGTTANTYVDGLLIPANTFGAGDIINVKSRVNKSTSVSTFTHRLYVNTTNNLSGSPILIATAATSAAANSFQGKLK